jgi:hypothetical protein
MSVIYVNINLEFISNDYKNSTHILLQVLLQILVYSVLLMLLCHVVYVCRVLFLVIQFNFIIMNFDFVCQKIADN